MPNSSSIYVLGRDAAALHSSGLRIGVRLVNNIAGAAAPQLSPTDLPFGLVHPTQSCAGCAVLAGPDALYEYYGGAVSDAVLAGGAGVLFMAPLLLCAIGGALATARASCLARREAAQRRRRRAGAWARAPVGSATLGAPGGAASINSPAGLAFVYDAEGEGGALARYPPPGGGLGAPLLADDGDPTQPPPALPAWSGAAQLGGYAPLTPARGAPFAVAGAGFYDDAAAARGPGGRLGDEDDDEDEELLAAYANDAHGCRCALLACSARGSCMPGGCCSRLCCAQFVVGGADGAPRRAQRRPFVRLHLALAGAALAAAAGVVFLLPLAQQLAAPGGPAAAAGAVHSSAAAAYAQLSGGAWGAAGLARAAAQLLSALQQAKAPPALARAAQDLQAAAAALSGAAHEAAGGALAARAAARFAAGAADTFQAAAVVLPAVASALLLAAAALAWCGARRPPRAREEDDGDEEDEAAAAPPPPPRSAASQGRRDEARARAQRLRCALGWACWLAPAAAALCLAGGATLLSQLFLAADACAEPEGTLLAVLGNSSLDWRRIAQREIGFADDDFDASDFEPRARDFDDDAGDDDDTAASRRAFAPLQGQGAWLARSARVHFAACGGSSAPDAAGGAAAAGATAALQNLVGALAGAGAGARAQLSDLEAAIAAHGFAPGAHAAIASALHRADGDLAVLQNATAAARAQLAQCGSLFAPWRAGVAAVCGPDGLAGDWRDLAAALLAAGFLGAAAAGYTAWAWTLLTHPAFSKLYFERVAPAREQRRRARRARELREGSPGAGPSAGAPPDAAAGAGAGAGEDPAQEREGEAAPPREDEQRQLLLQQRGFFPPLQPSPGMLSPGLLPGSPLGAATVASGGASVGGYGFGYTFAGSRAGDVSTPMLLEGDGAASPAPSGFASPAAAVFSPQQLAQQQQWLRAQRAYAQQGAAAAGAGAGAGAGAQLLPLSPAATVGGASAASFAASASFFVPRAAAGGGAPRAPPPPPLPQAMHRPGSTQLPPSPSASSVYTTRTAFSVASALPPLPPGQFRPAAL